MDKEGRIRALNAILAGRSPQAAEHFAEAQKAIDFAFMQGVEIGSVGGFAREILKIYDPDSALEFVDIEGDYFDPLFKIDEIRTAAKRLAKHDKPILVVAGLDSASKNSSKRWTPKKRAQYFENLDIVESHILRYESSIPQIEIIFV